MSTWILLRGWGRETRHWGEFPSQLRAALPGAEVIALDLPGNGASHAAASSTNVAGLVAHCRAGLAARGIAQPLHLLGLSLGAMTCIEWSRKYPQEVAGCVLLNTSVRPFSAFHERLKPRNYATLLRLVCGRDVRARESAILQLTSTAYGAHGAIVDEWIRFGAERPVRRMNVLRQLVAAARYRAPDTAPSVPMLVLAGAGDRLVEPRCSESLARNWGVPFAMHPTAGHDLTLDDGRWVATQVERWLRPS